MRRNTALPGPSDPIWRGQRQPTPSEIEAMKAIPWEEWQFRALPEDLTRYFRTDAGGAPVRVADLVATRARPKGIANANRLMWLAYWGIESPRKPISLATCESGVGVAGELTDCEGKWGVADGNSTYANAKASGWTHLLGRLETPEHHNPRAPKVQQVYMGKADEILDIIPKRKDAHISGDSPATLRRVLGKGKWHIVSHRGVWSKTGWHQWQDAMWEARLMLREGRVVGFNGEIDGKTFVKPSAPEWANPGGRTASAWGMSGPSGPSVVVGISGGGEGFKPARTLREARGAVMQFVSDNGLAAPQMSPRFGLIVDGSGEILGRVNYGGRVWRTSPGIRFDQAGALVDTSVELTGLERSLASLRPPAPEVEYREWVAAAEERAGRISDAASQKEYERSMRALKAAIQASDWPRAAKAWRATVDILDRFPSW